jgi:hypothetical protein
MTSTLIVERHHEYMIYSGGVLSILLTDGPRFFGTCTKMYTQLCMYLYSVITEMEIAIHGAETKLFAILFDLISLSCIATKILKLIKFMVGSCSQVPVACQ